MSVKNSIAIMLLCSFNLLAQPPTDWVNTFHYGRNEHFSDIYTIPGNGYVCSGWIYTDHGADQTTDIIVTRINDEGEELWHGIYGMNVEDGDVIDRANDIIQTDSSTFVVAATSQIWPNGRNPRHAVALHIDEDGEIVWYNDYGTGALNEVIELKSGEFLFCGGSEAQGYILCLDFDGNVIWQRRYGEERANSFSTMRETAGGVVLGGTVIIGTPNRTETINGWAVKVDFEGELIWEHQYDYRYNDSFGGMSSTEGQDFIFTGGSWALDDGRTGQDLLIVKINNEGVEIWSHLIDVTGNNLYDYGAEVFRLNDDGFVLAGGYDRGRYFPAHPMAMRIRSNGTERWHEIYEFEEWAGFGHGNTFSCVVRGNDNSYVACGTVDCTGLEEANNAFVMKLEPEVLAPQFISWSPFDTMLTVLQGDTVDFMVRVRDDQGDEVSYLWIMGEDTLSTDSTTTIIFGETGEFEVQCEVTDGELAPTITWHLSVVEWYIDSFLPDSTNIAIRRRTTLDFSHHVRAIEEFEFEYQWEHFGRGGNFEFEGEDSARFDFDLTGDHIIRAWVIKDEESKTVEWDVNVRSIIWWWWPHENVLSAQDDTTIVFEVFPFNEESDSLEYSWFLDDEVLDCDTSLIEISFPEIGEYEIIAYVQEGVEVDTIRWTIDVLERSFTADDTDYADLPTTPVLYPASPNPFNSSVKLSMYLPKENHVSLSVFDINGREVSRLADGNIGVGNQTFVWNAGDFPAGVYVVRMKTRDVVEMEKVVLVR